MDWLTLVLDNLALFAGVTVWAVLGDLAGLWEFPLTLS